MPPSTGSVAPDASLAELSGAPVTLRALCAGGPAVLAFTKHDCEASVAAAPALRRLAGVPGLVVAVISQDEAEETRAFAATHGWSAPLRVLRDPEPWPASEAFGVVATPTLVLVAPGGRVEAVVEGWSRAEVNALAARAAALAGAAPREVSPPGEGPDFRPG